MGKVTLSQYLGGRAVKYAENYWNKVSNGDAGDGRVLTSFGVNPQCGVTKLPDGTPFLHEASISESYGTLTQGDFVLYPADDVLQKTETVTFKLGQIKDLGGGFLLSEGSKLSEYLVKSIDEVTADINGTSTTLTKLQWIPRPERNWKVKPEDYIRYDKDEPAPITKIRLIGTKATDGIKTSGTFTEIPNGTKLTVTYSYVKKARRISWASIDDCAHFVSCCLLAGGMPVWDNDKTGGQKRPCTKGQHDVNGLYAMFKWMEKRALVSFVVDKKVWIKEGEDEATAEQAWTDLFKKEMYPGDVVLFHRDDTNSYTHSCLYAGTMKTTMDPTEYPRTSCHTFCRYPNDECKWDNARWHLNRKYGWSFTLVHMKPYEPESI